MKTGFIEEQNEEFYKNILDAASEGIIVIDKSRKIYYQNKVMTKLFGATVGKQCYNAFFGFSEP